MIVVTTSPIVPQHNILIEAFVQMNFSCFLLWKFFVRFLTKHKHTEFRMGKTHKLKPICLTQITNADIISTERRTTDNDAC